MAESQQTHLTLITLKGSLQAKLNEQHAQMADLQAEMEKTTNELQAVSTTLMLLGYEKSQKEAPVEIPKPSVEIGDLKGLTQLDAMKKIARANNNRLRTNEARRLLVRAGLITNPKNAANIVFSVINRSEQFRRVEPGVYEIIEDAEKLSRKEVGDAVKSLASIFTPFGSAVKYSE